MVHKILDNGVVREMTAEETILRDNEIASDEQKLIQKNNEAQAKEDLKASAKAKLIAGEALTEDEANTIVL